MHQLGANVVRIEADALHALALRLEGPMAADFLRALDLLARCNGRTVVSGMGKSGIIARKIAATLASTGTPALFLHPAEAAHGDIGMLVRGDVFIALSSSGETEELVRLLPLLKRLGTPLISLTCDGLYASSARRSTLAQAAHIALDCSIAQEAGALGLAPTASTTCMLALGDALAVALAHQRGFQPQDFADLHPGGLLGKRLARVSALMHTGAALPCVSPQTHMPAVIHEMSSKRLGMTTVIDDQRKLLGVISDGDLRRLLERQGKQALDLTAEAVMTRTPQTISADEFAAAALRQMEERKITALVVTDQGKLTGVLHLHDLWGTELL